MAPYLGTILFLIGFYLAVKFAGWAFMRFQSSQVVFEYQRGLLYRRGVFERLLEPGLHRIFGGHIQVRVLDVREAFVTLAGQEVMTSDGVSVRISLVARQQIVDPHLFVTRSENGTSAAYLLVQPALREVVASMTADDLLTVRGEIGARVQELSSPPVQDLGLHLNGVEVKDIMFPGELKNVMTQVVRAQKEAQAALERARGENAALRSLANSARMLENNPALMQLRILQSLSEAKGATIVLNTTDSPLPPAPAVDGILPEP
jgi:regulator of protease activity HflC (stomatin/prohibitin superfamily)